MRLGKLLSVGEVVEPEPAADRLATEPPAARQEPAPHIPARAASGDDHAEVPAAAPARR